MNQILSAFEPYDVDLGQQAAYDYIRKLPGMSDDRVFFTALVGACHTAPVLLICGFHFILECACSSAWLDQFRWQPGRRPPAELVRKCLVYVMLIHIFSIVGSYFVFSKAMIGWSPQLLTGRLPGVITILVQLSISHFLTDFLFYLGHRLLHTGPFYRWIHKQHHQFNVTVGIAAQYAHPLELLIGNVIPVMFAPVFFQYHFAVLCLWLFLAMGGTTSQHSGYRWPLSGSDDFHDFHHYFIRCNFGSRPLWDGVFGTDKEYREYHRLGKMPYQIAAALPKAKSK